MPSKYDSYTKAELLSLCESRKVKVSKAMKKQELIDAIKKAPRKKQKGGAILRINPLNLIKAVENVANVNIDEIKKILKIGKFNIGNEYIYIGYFEHNKQQVVFHIEQKEIGNDDHVVKCIEIQNTTKSFITDYLFRSELINVFDDKDTEIKEFSFTFLKEGEYILNIPTPPQGEKSQGGQ